MTNPTYTEYGYRKADGTYVWPDGDGDLSLGNGNYAAASNAPHGDYAGATIDVERIRRALPAGAVLVTRQWAAVEPAEVAVPLPTTGGSLIRATVGGVRRVLMLADRTPRPGYLHWFAAATSPDATDYGWIADRDLSDVEIIHEEGK
jgi:hypothetical protein